MEVGPLRVTDYPPSLCEWRTLLGIMAITQLAVLMMALGRTESIGLPWLTVTSSYAQCLALFCAASACTVRAWLNRLSVRDAWVSNWLVVLLAAVAFSYLCGVIGTVLGVGPGQAGLAPFMLKSTVAVGLVHDALLRYLFVRSQWQMEQWAQADARVQALQARIRPHFLFNSLNTIASLVEEDPVAAERATEDLADLFRGSMRRADALIPLSEELSLARKYLDMEQRRLGARLEVDWQIDALPGDIPVLPLVLQPLLENAVLHGVQALEPGGTVRVIGTCQPDGVTITIRNPVAEQRTALPEPDSHGMALDNIRRRLELAHGEHASLLTNEDGRHFYAVLSLPRSTAS